MDMVPRFVMVEGERLSRGAETQGKKVSSSIKAKNFRESRAGWLYSMLTSETYRPGISRVISDAMTVALIPAAISFPATFAISAALVLNNVSTNPAPFECP